MTSIYIQNEKENHLLTQILNFLCVNTCKSESLHSVLTSSKKGSFYRCSRNVLKFRIIQSKSSKYICRCSDASQLCSVFLSCSSFLWKKNAIKNNHVISVFISHIVFHYYYCVQSLHLCCVSSYADKWTLLPPTGLQCVCAGVLLVCQKWRKPVWFYVFLLMVLFCHNTLWLKESFNDCKVVVIKTWQSENMFGLKDWSSCFLLLDVTILPADKEVVLLSLTLRLQRHGE